ncbi:MAG: hypothetical protein Q8L22_25865 [Reyranella sp.]|nr:hypothetical protein [Reyranella sp.]
MTEDELQKLLETTLPAADLHGLFVEECQDQEVRLRFSPAAGGSWSMPALLSLIDTALKAASGVTAELSHLNVTILKPVQAADVISLSRVIRRDGDRIHAEAWLFSHAAVDPVLHATASLSIRPR